MDKVLIIYASTHGHTGTISSRLAEMLEARGLSTRVHEAQKSDTFDPSPFDSVIALASIHAERHQSKMVKWAEANSEALNQKKSAFLSVSLSAAAKAPEVIEANLRYAQDFSERTGWNPDRVEIVAGCLQYTAYSFFNKFLMKRLAKRKGLPLDTSQNYEYTDWDVLREFAGTFPNPI